MSSLIYDKPYNLTSGEFIFPIKYTGKLGFWNLNTYWDRIYNYNLNCNLHFEIFFYNVFLSYSMWNFEHLPWSWNKSRVVIISTIRNIYYEYEFWYKYCNLSAVDLDQRFLKTHALFFCFLIIYFFGKMFTLFKFNAILSIKMFWFDFD